MHAFSQIECLSRSSFICFFSDKWLPYGCKAPPHLLKPQCGSDAADIPSRVIEVSPQESKIVSFCRTSPCFGL